MIKHQLCVVLDHGIIRNQNLSVKPFVIQKLEFHFDKLKEMADSNFQCKKDIEGDDG